MSVPRVGIHRLIDAGRRLQKYEDQPCVCTGKAWNRKNSLIARSCEKTPAGIWTIDFVQEIIWFGDNPCRKYKENHGIRDRKKTAKNTKNTKVYAQPIQEIQRKLRFFDRSLKPGTIKNDRPGGTLVQGLNLYTIKGWAPRGRFYGPGARKTQKTKKLWKSGQAMAPDAGNAHDFLHWRNCLRRRCWRRRVGWRPAPSFPSFSTDVAVALSKNNLFEVFKKSVKTAVPDDGRPPWALVLTKLVE